MENERVIFEEQAKIFRALSNPIRLYIINELESKEWCLCELTEKIPLDKSTISRHLKILRDAGITFARKEGNVIYYSLKFHCILDYSKCIKNLIIQNVKEQLR